MPPVHDHYIIYIGKRASMRKTIRSFFMIIFSFLAVCVTSSNAFALVCGPATYYSGDPTMVLTWSLNSGSRSLTDNISVLAYLKNAAVGERIWTSKVFTQGVGCYSELDDSASENVYVYPFPKLVASDLPAGVEVGLILDGEDLGIFDPNKTLMERRKMLTWVVSSALRGKYISFQIYLKKTGEIGTTVAKSITIFQLDGVGGLNGTTTNFNISLTGWENMASVDCNAVNSSLNAKLTGFNSSSILKGEATQTIQNALAINISCTSENSTVIPQIKTFTGALTVLAQT